MAPNDREERRNARMRGAGITTVGSFSIAPSAFRAPQVPRQKTPQSIAQSKRSSRSGSRTPAPISSSRKTPRTRTAGGVSGSVGRQRGASSTTKNSVKTARSKQGAKTPGRQSGAPTAFVTPAIIGKRKRKQQNAYPGDDEEDELEQHNEEHMSAQKPSTSASTTRIKSKSPKEPDEGPDELSMIDEDHVVSSGQKSVNRTSQLTDSPVPSSLKKRSSGQMPRIESEPINEGVAKLTRIGGTPITPAVTQSRPKKDKLSLKRRSTQSKVSKPREHGSEDELSPDKPSSSKEPVITIRNASARRHRRVIESEETEDLDEDYIDELSPENPRPRHRRSETVEESLFVGSDNKEIDELSPEATTRPQKRMQQSTIFLDDESSRPGSELREITSSVLPRPPLQPTQPNIRAQKPTVNNAHKSARNESSQPPKKRQRSSGNGFPITVWRPKNANPSVIPSWARPKGINSVDVLSQFSREMVNKQVDRVVSRTDAIRDKSARKHERGRIGVLQLFWEDLEDKLFVLSEAVNTNAVAASRLKHLRKEKFQLRAEYLETRKQQDEVLLRVDQVRLQHQRDVMAHSAQVELNESIFDIQAAIEAGREYARAQGRGDEGPDIPLCMLLEDVASDVGLQGRAGLLDTVRGFHGMLETSTNALEGRA